MKELKRVENILLSEGYVFERKDLSRPWGGFWAIDPSQKSKFVRQFFPECFSIIEDSWSISPKILMVAPHQRLSWQYHNRRSELWKVIDGSVGVIKSENDDEGDLRVCIPNELVRLNKGDRHRLLGMDNWGMVAEIWLHTDANNPSDENDIVRVQDDFGRTSLSV